MKKRIKRSRFWKVSANEYQQLINKGYSLTDIIKHLGLRPAGGNHDTLRQVLNEYQISYFRNIRRGTTRVENKQLFIRNADISRATVRRRILKLNLIEYKCEICQNQATWLERPLILILDHRNGDPIDHRLANLRWLCPNCNSQLDTHCGKNINRR